MNMEPGLLFPQRLTDRCASRRGSAPGIRSVDRQALIGPDQFTGPIITYGVGPSFDLVGA